MHTWRIGSSSPLDFSSPSPPLYFEQLLCAPHYSYLCSIHLRSANLRFGRDGTLPLLTPLLRHAMQSIYVPQSLGLANSSLITKSDQAPVAVAVVLLSDPLDVAPAVLFVCCVATTSLIVLSLLSVVLFVFVVVMLDVIVGSHALRFSALSILAVETLMFYCSYKLPLV